jgi:hypothetical protein
VPRASNRIDVVDTLSYDRPASSVSGARVPGSDSMGEDPGDHGGLGDHGDDPHQPLAPGTGERMRAARSDQSR